MMQFFTQGRFFSLNQILQEEVYDKDFQMRTPLHYACYGGVDLNNP